RHLVVTEEAFRAGLPGEPLVAQLTANGNHVVPATPAAPAGLAGRGGQESGSGFTDLGGVPGLGQAPGVRISGPLRRSQGTAPEWGAHTGSGRGATNGAAGHGATNGAPGLGPDELPRRHHGQPGTPAGPGQASAQSPADAGATPVGMPASSFDVFSPRQQPQAPGDTPRPAGSSPFASPGPSSFPAGGAPYSDQPAPFPGWT